MPREPGVEWAAAPVSRLNILTAQLGSFSLHTARVPGRPHHLRGALRRELHLRLAFPQRTLFDGFVNGQHGVESHGDYVPSAVVATAPTPPHRDRTVYARCRAASATHHAFSPPPPPPESSWRHTLIEIRDCEPSSTV